MTGASLNLKSLAINQDSLHQLEPFSIKPQPASPHKLPSHKEPFSYIHYNHENIIESLLVHDNRYKKSLKRKGKVFNDINEHLVPADH